jgi:AbrB family looped-hinge helix DNA binding protein
LLHGKYDGIFKPMNATIDRAGRLVVPKPIREAAHLRPGTQVRFRLADGRVEIEPVPMTVTFERSGSLVVAVPTGEQPVLTQSDVAEAISTVRT